MLSNNKENPTTQPYFSKFKVKTKLSRQCFTDSGVRTTIAQNHHYVYKKKHIFNQQSKKRLHTTS